MAHSSASRSLLGLATRFKQLNALDPLTQCLAPRLIRSFASETHLPISKLAKEMEVGLVRGVEVQLGERPKSLDLSDVDTPPTAPGITTSASPAEVYTLEQPVLATRYKWPSIEPSGYALYSPKYLDAPLRRDILHRAVIYEADMTRQGTASTKWRFDVHGSNRKLYQQKGTGKARVRDKKSPLRRGGGVAFGPKPRDFSTELPHKVYAQAFRIALSHRLRRNELIILDNVIDLPEGNTARFLNNIFEANGWGQGYGRSLFVKGAKEPETQRLYEAMGTIGEHGDLKDLDDVDVKDLLMSGRVVIERDALVKLLARTSMLEKQTSIFKKSSTLFTFGKSKERVRERGQHLVPEPIVQYL